MSDPDAERWDAVEEAAELLLLGERQAALEQLRGVLEADPQNHYAYFHLGNAFFELAKYEPARDAYRAAVRLVPRYLGAHVALSHTSRLLGEHDEAIFEAEEALRAFPEDGDALYAAGLALAAKGSKRRASEVFERFLATSPELEVTLEVRGMLSMLEKSQEGEPLVLA